MIYEYKCDIHGIFEIQQSIKEPPLDRCPQCVQKNLVEHYCEKCNSLLKAANEEIPFTADHVDYMDSNNIICKTCGTEVAPRWHKPKKLISLSSFILKGGSWASEGYK